LKNIAKYEKFSRYKGDELKYNLMEVNEYEDKLLMPLKDYSENSKSNDDKKVIRIPMPK
jgi:hypothetical protein